ncbi:MAG: sensor histidine kinase [Anaerolineae bacterium]
MKWTREGWDARWLAALIPGAAGILTSALLNRWLEQPPQLYVRADIVALSWMVGVGLSLVSVAGLGIHRAATSRAEAARLAAHAQAGEERQRFLRRLDHELKNPLTAIQVALANVDYATTSQSRAEALDSVKTQTQRIGRLIADLRKLAELETRSLEFGPVDLSELLQEVVLLVQGSVPEGAPGSGSDEPEALDRQLNLIVPQAPWPLPEISGDWDLIFLAVYNLLSNAIKFTEPGDTVEVRAFEDGRYIVIEVADTGPGIPAEEQALVWEELYRAKASRGIPGSGLGLALVRAIVNRHGGRASLRSRAGQGTVVTMRLPIRQEPRT